MSLLFFTAVLSAEAGFGQGPRACAGSVAAENAGLACDSSMAMSPISMQGEAKGVQTPGSPQQTADRMAQALRYCQPAC